MAMNVFSAFQNSKFRFGVLASAVFLLTATTTQAGFEWVPAAEPKPAPAPAAPATPPAAVQPPSSQLLMHEPQPLSPLPPLEEPVEAMPLQAPQPQTTAKGNVLKVKRMSDTAAPEETAAVPQPLGPSDTAAEATPPPLPELLEEPSHTKTTVVMPEDAPQSARSSVSEGKILDIQPYPEGQAPTAAVPMPIQNMNIEQGPDVVGFGTDMPLALALQQIAPAGYAFSFGENINPGAKVSWTGGQGWVDVMRDMIAPLGLQADVRGKAIFIHDQQHSFNAAPVPPIETPAEEESVAMLASDIAPASGNEATQEPVTLTNKYADESESMPRIRRHGVKDPGDQKQEQPVETLSSMESVPPASSPTAINSPVPQNMEIWEAEKGDSLKQTLSNWSKQGQFELEWNAAHDYTLETNILVAGRVDSAIKSLLTNGLNPQNAPSLTFLKNTGTSSKLVIEGS